MNLRIRSTTLVVTAVLSVSALSGCGSSPEGSTDGARTVVAAFYPLAWVAERVAGPGYDVVNLTTPGAEPHDLELSIRQTAELAGAAVVIHESGMQPAVDDAIEAEASGAVIDVVDVVALRPTAATADGHDHEHGDSDEHSEEEGAEDQEVDPHFWLDPALMAELTEAVADRLSELDPDHADDYAARAQKTVTELERLDRDYADTLAGCERTTVVVNHGAFGYLDKYGLDLHSIAGLSPTAEPTAATLAELREVIETDGITTVFTETLASPKNAETLADSVGVDTAVLDPIEGLTDDTAGEDYLSLMQRNLTTLAQANGC